MKIELTCPAGHTHQYYDDHPTLTTDIAWVDGDDPNVHTTYYVCSTCDMEFMTVEQRSKMDVRPALPMGSYIEPPVNDCVTVVVTDSDGRRVIKKTKLLPE